MADLVEDVLSVEKECDQLLSEASEKVAELGKQTVEQIDAERKQADEAFKSEAESLRRQSAETLKAEQQKLSEEHQAAAESLKQIPQETLDLHVKKVLDHLLEG